MESEVGRVDRVGGIDVCQLGGGEVKPQAIGARCEVDQCFEMGL